MQDNYPQKFQLQKLTEEKRLDYFKNNRDKFPFFGGDIESLILHLNIVELTMVEL